MPLTFLLCGAYNAHMETVLLLVLFMMNSDDASREKMKSFLNFYRENRPLITALVQAQNGGEIPQNPQHIAQKPAEEADKNRPPQEVGDQSVLEEYLKRFSV